MFNLLTMPDFPRVNVAEHAGASYVKLSSVSMFSHMKRLVPSHVRSRQPAFSTVSHIIHRKPKQLSRGPGRCRMFIPMD